MEIVVINDGICHNHMLILGLENSINGDCGEPVQCVQLR